MEFSLRNMLAPLLAIPKEALHDERMRRQAIVYQIRKTVISDDGIRAYYT